MAVLILATDAGDRRVALEAVNAIGRFRPSTILLNDPQLSKQHCVIEHRAAGATWVLRDLGSTNGTRLNGNDVEGEMPLKNGDQIQIGSTRAIFVDGADAAGRSTTTRLEDVALASVAVRGEVLGSRARMSVAQTYRNTESRPIEAVYTFPLPADATVVGFATTCGGRRVDAEVKERDVAFQGYDDAITAGHGAALLERARPNVFTCNVGNVLPGEEVQVEVEYVQRLVADEGTVRMTIPTLVAPRYVPGTPKGDRTGHGVASPTDAVPDADLVSPPTGNVDYRVTLDLVVRLGGGATIRCVSHPIATRSDGDAVHVAFANDAVPLDRDVVLAFEATTGERPVSTIALHRDPKSDTKGYFAATFVPDLFEGRAEAAPLDVVFVVDRSGSMQGASMVEAKRALHLCLRNLREGDRFLIVGFASTMAPHADDLVPLTQTTLHEADAWIDALDAGGGTEMLTPLLHATRMAPDGVVVLLTDGQVANEAEIENEVMRARKTARVYTFGIGTAVSDALLSSLSKRTNGAMETIHPGERIDAKVISIFARAVAERITGVTVTVRGVEADELAPLPLPDVVDGEPWTILGRYEGSGQGAIEIRGQRKGERFSLDVPVDFTMAANDPVIARFWAAERVRDLEAASLDGRRAESNKARIVKLAIEHRIASSHTSFVAIEKRTGERMAQGIPETRVVPVSAPAGWGVPMGSTVAASGVARTMSRSRSVPAGPGLPPPAPMAARAPIAARVQSPVAMASHSEEKTRVCSISAYAPVAASAGPPPLAGRLAGGPDVDGSTDPIADLFARQLASGMWSEGDDSPRALLVATLVALRVLLAARLERESPELAKYRVQLAKAATATLATLAIMATEDASAADGVLAALLLVVPSARARLEITRFVSARGAMGHLEGALEDPARLRVTASIASV